jgi:hypothetical protein
MRARTIVAVCATAAASGGLFLGVRAGSSQGGGADAGATRTGTNTAKVERRDLVERESLDGTLGFAGSRTVANQLRATLTRMPSVGSVIGLGESLYEVDGRPSAWLLYGARPAWRGFEPGMSDGEDVAQLERSLQALGYDPGLVNEGFSDSTKAAVKRFQDDRGMKADGRLEPGEVVFLPGRVRIQRRKASTGMTLGPGQEVLETTSTKRVVTVQLDASRQTLVARGDSVEVELPSGDVVRGRITKVSRVAQPPAQEGDVPTVEVSIVLRGRAGTRAFDGAPVVVGIAQERRRNALSVPVAALLALEGGGSAVEVVGAGGTTRTVRVRTGLFADGYAEVSGRRLREGARVVVPDEL